MTKSKSVPANAAELRQRAEERLREKSRRSEVGGQNGAEETERLVHELQVHQIELELQNEELERTRAELEAGLERYTDLYDFAPTGYVTLDRNGTIRKTNLTGERLLGWERSRLVGGRFGLFVSMEHRSTFNDFLEKVFENRAKQVCEVALGSGASPWLHIEAVASQDGGQECRAVLVDITERRRMEETLRMSERLYRAIGESIEYGVWVCAPDGRNTYVSESFLKLVGFTQEQCSNFGWGDVLHPDDAERTIAKWKDCVRTGGKWDIEHRFRGVDGRWHPILARGVPVRNERGEIDCWAGINLDISHLKQTEADLSEREAALREADRHKNEFLAVLSHELRNPLAPIVNSLYILDHAAAGSDQARRAQAVIGRQVGQLSRLVDDLLDVTRISRNKLSLRRQRLELNELVRRTTEDHRPQFEKNEVRLEIRPAPEPVFVDGDANRLAQVVGNLLQNAAKFTGPGGTTSVTVGTDTVARRAVVRVVDTGIGIAEEMLAHLFQPFAQADTALDRHQGGLGLGLVLVKGLVALHGGDIDAHSAGPGQGAEFVVCLPLALEEAPADRVAHSSTPAPGGRRRVLVIDDDFDAADSLREALEFSEHEVEVAYTGSAGIAKAREFKPDVLLCDVGLPGLNGYGVARAFKADEALRSVYLVALTGHALPEDLAKAQEAGFDRHLAKPPSLEQIEELLSAFAREALRNQRGREDSPP